MLKAEYNIDKIIKQINKYNYVSFDIFDTLIKRNVPKPSDIFKLIELEYNNNYEKKINNYKEIRINAEIEARNIAKGREPNLDDIYKKINLNQKEYDIENLKKIEISLELKFCQQNKDFYPIYKYCIEQKKNIIITSDMYLNKEYIEEILRNAGINKYDYLFISNDVKLNKNRGKLYSYILNKLNIKGKDLIHIGDSKRADYLMPRMYQINSILIPKDINKLRYYNDKSIQNNKEQKFLYDIIEKFINNNIPQNENEYYKLGYEVLGILLYGYTKWLLEELKKNNIKKIFFLAREGALLKKAFDIINDTDIESRYLYVSRRSTRVPLLKYATELEDVFSIIKMRRITTIKDFFGQIGLNCENYKDLLEKYKCNEATNIKQIDNIKELFYEIKSDMITNANEEEKKLLGYLKQEGFEGKIAVSDIGWRGTMQNALNQIATKNDILVNIMGFYIAQIKDEKIHQKNKIQAYLISDNDTEIYKKIRPFSNLFESLFLAQHGTTIKYTFDKEVYLPVLEKIEYTKEEQLIFKTIQEGAIQFINDYIIKDYSIIEIFPICSFLNIKKIGLNPTLRDVNLFANITYLETIKTTFANPKSLIFYIIHPKDFYIDFCNCSWKMGFLKKIFKLKLPYYNIYNIVNYIEKK